MNTKTKLEYCNFSNSSLNIGIFGGAFDPPHFGHLNLCLDIINKHKLDEIWWVVSSVNLLKPSATSSNLKRLELCKKMTNNFPKIKVILDKSLTNSPFMYDILERLAKKMPKTKFSLIIGSDNLKNFDKWKKFREILLNYHIMVYVRPKNIYNVIRGKIASQVKKISINKNFNSNLQILRNKNYNISSTQIRNNYEN